jgi:hypothetical protein
MPLGCCDKNMGTYNLSQSPGEVGPGGPLELSLTVELCETGRCCPPGAPHPGVGRPCCQSWAEVCPVGWALASGTSGLQNTYSE